jgi:hypothetical protein
MTRLPARGPAASGQRRIPHVRPQGRQRPAWKQAWAATGSRSLAWPRRVTGTPTSLTLHSRTTGSASRPRTHGGRAVRGPGVPDPDGAAQDTKGRFIFRTADATLWIYGNLADGLKVVTDLQAGAIMSVTGLLIVQESRTKRLIHAERRPRGHPSYPERLGQPRSASFTPWLGAPLEESCDCGRVRIPIAGLGLVDAHAPRLPARAVTVGDASASTGAVAARGQRRRSARHRGAHRLSELPFLS